MIHNQILYLKTFTSIFKYFMDYGLLATLKMKLRNP